VDKTANIQDAARKAALGSFKDFGQTIARADYCLVEYSRVNEFIEELEIQIEKLKFKKQCNIENHKHLDKVCALLEGHEGTVVIGNANAHRDKKLEATVILSPKPDCKLMRAPVFGPILPIFPFN